MFWGFITIKIQKASFLDAAFQKVPDIDHSSVHSDWKWQPPDLSEPAPLIQFTHIRTSFRKVRFGESLEEIVVSPFERLAKYFTVFSKLFFIQYIYFWFYP